MTAVILNTTQYFPYSQKDPCHSLLEKVKAR